MGTVGDLSSRALRGTTPLAKHLWLLRSATRSAAWSTPPGSNIKLSDQTNHANPKVWFFVSKSSTPSGRRTCQERFASTIYPTRRDAACCFSTITNDVFPDKNLPQAWNLREVMRVGSWRAAGGHAGRSFRSSKCQYPGICFARW